MSKTVAPFGSWRTPITSELVVRAAAGLGAARFDGASVWWSESRPGEAGRVVLVRDGEDVLPAPWNARTAVHEYGGGAWWVSAGTAWFTHWADQRLYRLRRGETPDPLTPEPAQPRALRYADGQVSPDGARIACVRERHLASGEVLNEIVILDAQQPGEPAVVGSGADFCSDPRWSPDGRRLAWLAWNHPDMPWDATRLLVDGKVVVDGTVTVNGMRESLSQPSWGPDGALYFLSDRSGWWNLYRWNGGGVEAVVTLEAEIGEPQWVFGQSRYAFLDGGRIALAYGRDGFDHLAVWDGARLHTLELPYSSVHSVVAQGDEVLFIGASPSAEPALVKLRLDGVRVAESRVVRPPRNLGLDAEWFSRPEPMRFPSADGRTCHALFYPPRSPTHEGPAGERPPLLVFIHGGPTSAAAPTLQLGIQYWTSRGFAVVDVNYGGSTGYGRAYRELLKGSWGVVDVQDCEAAARHLAQAGRVDPARLCIRGGSAGGYTTLAALAFGDTFAAGASHFGVADLEALASDTHKFESRYLDGLIAPWPAQREVYRGRSPIHHLDRFDKPLAVFQGLEDRVVPPNQAEMIVDALRKKGVPVAYVPFEGEQHGFRQAKNIRRALDGELSFYAQIFGIPLPPEEGIEPVRIENLQR